MSAVLVAHACSRLVLCRVPLAIFFFAIAALPGALGQCSEARPQICEFNFNLQECLVSRSYGTNLLRRYEGGALSSVADHLMACEDAGNNGNCIDLEGCESDANGLCVAERMWTVSRMVARRSSGGLGLGHERCGLFGSILEQSGLCFNSANQSHCEDIQQGEFVRHCFWNATQGSCAVSEEVLMTWLVQDYRDEFARIALQRDGCASRSSQSTCTAASECRWEAAQPTSASGTSIGRLLRYTTTATPVAGRCDLRVVDSLLAVAGDNCPLKTMFRRHADCAEASTNGSSSCTARQRSDGLPICVWADDQCETHPIALEFDLLQSLGASNLDLSGYVRRAQASCTGLPLGLCEDECEVRVSSGSSRSTPLFTVIEAISLLGLVCGTAKLF